MITKVSSVGTRIIGDLVCILLDTKVMKLSAIIGRTLKDFTKLCKTCLTSKLLCFDYGNIQ